MVLECLSCRLWGCVGSAHPVYGQPGEHNPVSCGPFSVSPMGGGWGPATDKVKAPPGSLSQDREGPSSAPPLYGSVVLLPRVSKTWWLYEALTGALLLKAIGGEARAGEGGEGGGRWEWLWSLHPQGGDCPCLTF